MVMVTGASGHVGAALVRLLVERGERVRACIMPGERFPALIGLDVEIEEVDVLVPEDVRRAVSGAEIVYHLAGMIGIHDEDERLMERVNVDGTRNVAIAARAAGVGRFVYVGSIHAYTRPPAGSDLKEELPFDPDNPAGAYDRTKARACLEVMRLAREGLPAVIVCPSGIIGPYDYRGSEMGSMVRRWMRPRRHVLFDGGFNFVDVRDVAEGIVAAGARGRVGESYLLPGTWVSLEDLRGAVQDATGAKRRAIRLPARLVLLGVRLLSGVLRIVGHRPAFTRYSIETVLSNSRTATDKAKTELGYAPRPLSETVRDTVAWWSRHPGLRPR